MCDRLLSDLSSLFDASYYETGLGSPYKRNSHWLNFFGVVADEINRSLRPSTVFDAGCALGFLVESFWDRGIECYGIDISEYAISQVRRDMQPYCRRQSILDPINGRYDLVTCIEVLEHLQPDDTELAISNITSASDAILFSSTPDDLTETTHFNVRPVIGWLTLFQKFGFAPDYNFDAGFVAPHAILLRKQAAAPESVLVLFSKWLKLRSALNERERRIASLEERTSEYGVRLNEAELLKQESGRNAGEMESLREQFRRSSAELDELRQERLQLSKQLTKAKEQGERTSRTIAELRSKHSETSIEFEPNALRERTSSPPVSVILPPAPEAEPSRLEFKEKLESKQRALYSANRKTKLQQEQIAQLGKILDNLRARLRVTEVEHALRSVNVTLVPLGRLAKMTLTEVNSRLTGKRRDRLKERLDLLRRIESIGKSSFFDPAWYSEAYPDLSGCNDLLFHYATQGWKEGRNPGPEFNGNLYLEHYPDVANSGINPLMHYLEFGKAEGRKIDSVLLEDGSRSSVALQKQAELIAHSPLFDSDWYLDNYPDVAAAGLDPIWHYLEHGEHEGRNPGPLFNSSWYLIRYPDVKESGVNALAHYLERGTQESRETQPVDTTTTETRLAKVAPDGEFDRRIEMMSASSLFDPQWYLAQYPEVKLFEKGPFVHYLEIGGHEGRNPGPNFDASWYLRRNPDVSAANLNPLLHYLEYGVSENRAIRPAASTRTIDALLQSHFPALTIPTFHVPAMPRRLTVITDSINSGRLYGGVGTALILSALLAKRIGADLRVVTRNEASITANVSHIFEVNGVSWEKDIEFLFVPLDGSRHMAVSENDFFLTTSWWTTRAARQAIEVSRIFYLLQEDERMFYPYGDERLRCEEVLHDENLTFIVNSELLFQHLVTGSECLANVERNGMWFEPAFPACNYYPEQADRLSVNRRFLFYARPENLRNLYWRGLEVIGSAIESGTFREYEWEFNFVGHGIETPVLPSGTRLAVHQNLSWEEYARLIRGMDVALCLMDTPHPSYPPLDLAASGAIVVTNQRGLKSSLDRYSENILCCEPNVGALTTGLRNAVQRLTDEALRLSNYSRNGLSRNWDTTLAPVLGKLAEFIDNGRP